MNILEYATIFQRVLDEEMIADLTSGWMESNAGQVIYTGGADIKIPSISTDGLGDYDRNGENGFPNGSVTMKYETMTMEMDRARSFSIDSMDVDETNFATAAGNVIGAFQKTKVVPEVDAYRYSKLAHIADTAGNSSTYAPAESSILDRLNQDLYEIWDIVGDGVPLVISMSTRVSRILDTSDKISRRLDVADFKKGEISTKVRTFNDVPILRIPSFRMKTQYIFKTGGIGQTEGGIEPPATAKDINWIICPRTAPIAVSKTDKIRIFAPDVNQKADAWKIDYRKYHDIWLPENRAAALRASITP